jgi:hypothetical protein
VYLRTNNLKTILPTHTKIKTRDIPIINHFIILSSTERASIITNKAIKKIIAEEIMVTPASSVEPFPSHHCAFYLQNK